MIDPGLRGRVAVVTGANQGIGAAAARALAAEGAHVLLTYLRVDMAGHGDPALPQSYDEARARSAEAVIEAIRQAGGRAEAFEADLADPAVVPGLFDRAEAAFGPVEILVNNAAFWHGDTFVPDRAERFGWRLMPVSPETCDRHFAVNGRAPALLIAEFARRHAARGASWGRIVSLTTGGAPWKATPWLPPPSLRRWGSLLTCSGRRPPIPAGSRHESPRNWRRRRRPAALRSPKRWPS